MVSIKRLVIDDDRWFKFPDEDTTYVRTIDEALPLLLAHEWNEVWLDHDMGLKSRDVSSLTKVLAHLAYKGELVKVGLFVIHTGNFVGGWAMLHDLKDHYTVARVRAEDHVDSARMDKEGLVA